MKLLILVMAIGLAASVSAEAIGLPDTEHLAALAGASRSIGGLPQNPPDLDAIRLGWTIAAATVVLAVVMIAVMALLVPRDDWNLRDTLDG